MSRSNLRIAGVLALAAFWPAGCNTGLRYYDVSGTVTLNGKPVEYAEMLIHPTSEGANRGRTVSVKVVNGKYDTKPVGGAPGGPAEWTISVAEPGSMRIKNPDKVSSDESEKFLSVKKQVFTQQIEVNGEEINISLP